MVLSLVKNTTLTASVFQQMRQDDMDREQHLTAEFLGQASWGELLELSRWY